MDHDDRELVWRGAPDDPRLPLLRDFGLKVQLGGAADPATPSIQPLTAGGLAALPEGPCLLLVGSAEQEAQCLAQLPAHVELVREPASALLLFERLRRLLGSLPQPAGWAQAAPQDALTGCLGRAGWTRQLLQRLAQPQAQAQALLLLDLDGFRGFNETHGHEAGDRALVELAQRCRRALATHDVLGRWGGDEFALLLQRYDADSLLHDARALLKHLSQTPLSPPPAGSLKRWLGAASTPLVAPSASAGLAWLGNGMRFAEVLAAADGALQRARRQGGACLVLAEAAPQPPPRDAAQTDPLSQMPNRAYCDARLTRECRAADAEGWPLALWLVDLRALGAINATQGHEAGDRALAALALAVRGQARLVDWTARVRASALAVLMPRTDAQGAQHAAERLRAAVAGLGLPLSEGLVQREAGEHAQALLQRAWLERQPLAAPVLMGTVDPPAA